MTARHEESLLNTGRLQTAVFNSAHVSSIATDDQGVIRSFNTGAERMLGYAAAEVLNRLCPNQMVDPDELAVRAGVLGEELGTTVWPGFGALVLKATLGVDDLYELTFIRKDGSRLPAIVSVTALRNAQGRIIGYLLIGTDNSARKQMEAAQVTLNLALEASNLELRRATAVAEKANLAKSDFLSRMSHELRSPLNAILGFAQLLVSEYPPPTPAQQTSVDQILRAGWYLLELIDEILDLSVIESGKLKLEDEAVPLAEVMQESEALISPEAGKRGIALSFSRFEGGWCVRADRKRLKQVLVNLLSNAVKYNRPNGAIVVECVAHSPQRTRICVRDTGAGLSPRQMAQLFQPFNRLGREGGAETGTGIGLMMCKRLVELMGGAIGAESRVNAGSVFWIELWTTPA